MKISLDLELTSDQEIELSQIIGCKKAELSRNIISFGNAALQEYVTMILGQKVFRRGSDMQEYRLFLMILEVFNNRIPDEQTVSRLFQTTASQSRSLIRSVMSKYQYQLRSAIDNSIIELIKSFNRSGEGVYAAVINCSNLVEELNRILAEIDGNLPPITKQRGSVSTFEAENSSYTKLCVKYDLSFEN